MKTALSSLTGVLYGYSNQQVVDLYTVDLGSYGKKYWTTNRAPVVSGAVIFSPGGEWVSSSTDFTGVTTYFPPSLSATLTGSNSSDRSNFSGVTAKSGQVLVMMCSNMDSTKTSIPTAASATFATNGNGNAWSTSLKHITGPNTTNTYSKHTGITLLTCTLISDITNSTITAYYSVYGAGCIGTINVFNSGCIIPLLGNTASLIPASAYDSGQSQVNITSSSPSGTVIFLGRVIGAQAAMTGCVFDTTLTENGFEFAGRYTGSITGTSQYVLVGATGTDNWDRVLMAVEVKPSSSYAGTWVTTYTGYNNPAVERGPSRTAVGTEVATIDLTVYPGPNLLGGLSMSLAAAQGVFDNAPVLVQRAYTNASGTIYTTVFNGNVTEVMPKSTEIGLVASSVMSKMRVPFPPKTFQQVCPYIFGDSNCKFDKATITDTSASNGGTTTTIQVAGNWTTDKFKLGTIWFIDGAMSGLIRTVTTDTNSGGNHIFTVYPAMPSTPTGNVSFAPGCSRFLSSSNSPKGCTQWSNNTHFGGFNSVPAPTTVGSK